MARMRARGGRAEWKRASFPTPLQVRWNHVESPQVALSAFIRAKKRYFAKPSWSSTKAYSSARSR